MPITRCPQCKTAFKASPEQLELAQGQVRCGRCAHVFDARLYLETWPDTPVTPSLAADASALFSVTIASDASLSPSLRRDECTASAVTATPTPVLWPIIATVLMLVLMWQFVVAQRDGLVAQAPALRPVVSALCACDITWPREPEAVVIESSSFTETPEGGYTVQLRLKNTQHHPVAMPALELSLTDSQDQVLVRRVFSAEALSLKDHVQALHDVQVALSFDLDDSVSQRVTGFRAFIFYP